MFGEDIDLADRTSMGKQTTDIVVHFKRNLESNFLNIVT